jgi:hypothetical protein
MMSMAKRTVLSLAANPCGTQPARARPGGALDPGGAEAQGGTVIASNWRRGGPLDLLRGLRDLKPAVVHFSGQGGSGGLFFQAAEGRARVISPSFHACTLRPASPASSCSCAGTIQAMSLQCRGDNE